MDPIAKEICAVLKTYPDFPKKGVLFCDVMPIFRKPDVFRKMVDLFAEHDKLEVQLESVTPGQNVVIIDDLLATGGSMQAAVNLIQAAGASVALCIVIVEIEELLGRQKLNAPVFALIPYSAALNN